VRTLRLALEYDGTDYHGFGIQPVAPTIQGALEAALSAALGHSVRVTAAGRTDAGVHAVGQVVSLRTHSMLDADATRRATNARLPADIRVRSVEEVTERFDARRSAAWRHYRYTIWRDAAPNIWWRRYSYHLPDPLNLPAMRRGTKRLVGRFDYAAFATHRTRSGKPERTTRTVLGARWTRHGAYWDFDIVADAFLRHMVRCIVGTLLLVGRNRITPADVTAILLGADRRGAGPTVPAAGLTLMQVGYPPMAPPAL
jgi:tRNA pseudouridine38-40 synthase